MSTPTWSKFAQNLYRRFITLTVRELSMHGAFIDSRPGLGRRSYEEMLVKNHSSLEEYTEMYKNARNHVQLSSAEPRP